MLRIFSVFVYIFYVKLFEIKTNKSVLSPSMSIERPTNTFTLSPEHEYTKNISLDCHCRFVEVKTRKQNVITYCSN